MADPATNLNARSDLSEYEIDTRPTGRPFRVVGSDDVEVAYGRFKTRDAAENLMRGMNDLNENWDRKNKRCRPPYRVQELRWEDVQ